MINATQNAAVELYYDASKKLETKSYGIQIPGGVHLNSDSEKLYIGVDSDLQIYHDGTENRVWGQNGRLDLRTTDANHIDILTNNGYAIW